MATLVSEALADGAQDSVTVTSSFFQVNTSGIQNGPERFQIQFQGDDSNWYNSQYVIQSNGTINGTFLAGTNACRANVLGMNGRTGLTAINAEIIFG